MSSRIQFNRAKISNLIQLVVVWSYFLCSFDYVSGQFNSAKILTKEELINNLKASGVLKSKDVAKVMLNVDRKDFCPKEPYHNNPQEIGYQATISSPHLHAYTLETLRENLKPGAKVLDVGSGSGYLSACMAVMIGNGRVIGIDHIPELVKFARENVKKNHEKLLTSGLLKFVTGDGRKGYLNEAPYDVINVGAATNLPTEDLIDQLKPGGRLFYPTGNLKVRHIFNIIEKHANGGWTVTNLYDESDVHLKSQSLVDKDTQLVGD